MARPTRRIDLTSCATSWARIGTRPALSSPHSTHVPAAVSAAIRRPWLTVAIALVIAALALIFTATRFTMTTDTAELISPDIDWRRHERAMDDAFPQLRDAMVVVVDGATPELAEAAATGLAARMSADPAHFRVVRRPDGGDFWDREGLLFAPVADVRATTAALIKAQPLLGQLAADPSLRGVAGSVSVMLDGVNEGSATLGDIAAPMRALAVATNRTLGGQPAYFSWQRLFAGSGAGAAPPTRRIILTRPVLDFGSLTPGEGAGDAVRAAAHALRLDGARGVTVRITGDVALSDEEFSTLRDNIGLVGIVMFGAMLAMLWLATRSLRLVGAIVATTLLGLVVTLAAGLLAVGRLNLISIAFIPLFVGLGIDFAIQICVRLNAEMAGGAEVSAGLRRAAAALGLPLLLAAGAVFLGFGAFLPTAYIGIAELGVIAGIGMVIALVASVTLLPALVVLAKPAAPRAEVGIAALAPVDRWLARRALGRPVELRAVDGGQHRAAAVGELRFQSDGPARSARAGDAHFRRPDPRSRPDPEHDRRAGARPRGGDAPGAPNRRPARGQAGGLARQLRARRPAGEARRDRRCGAAARHRDQPVRRRAGSR